MPAMSRIARPMGPSRLMTALAGLATALVLAACGGSGGSAGERQDSAPEITVLTHEPDYPWPGMPVQFRAGCIGAGPLGFTWAFGDGSPAQAGAQAVHTYASSAGGRRTVRLSCSDAAARTATRTLALDVYRRDLGDVARAHCEGLHPGHGWCRQHPLTTGPLFRDLQALDADTLWGIGRDGAVLRLGSDGRQVQALSRVRAFAAASHDVAWAALDDGIAYTRNGSRGEAAEWTRAALPAPSDPVTADANRVLHLFAASATQVWALTAGGLLRSTDGGATWRRTAWSAAGKRPVAVFASGSQFVWVIGVAGLLERSSDAGATWQPDPPSGIPPGADFTTVGVPPARDVAWVATADGAVLEMRFATRAWQIVREPQARAERFQSISLRAGTAWLAGHRVVDSQTGATEALLLRASGLSAVSPTPGSLSWSEVPIGRGETQLRSVGVYQSDGAWVASDRALYKASSFAADPVHALDAATTQTLRSISAPDVRVAWAVGGARTVLHSADGGRSWTQRPVPASADLLAIHAASALEAWVVEGSNRLLKTRDGGASWVAAAVPAAGTTALLAIGRSDERTLWLSGRAGTVLFSTDNGASWQRPSCGFPADLEFTALASRSAGSVWLLGQPSATVGLPGARLYVAHADGSRCEAVALPGAVHVTALSLGSVGNIWAIGRDAAAGGTTLLWHSTDGGLSWRRLPLPGIRQPLSLAAGSAATAWVGSRDALWKIRVDATGAHPLLQAAVPGDAAPVLALQAIDGQTLWGVGASGQVWKTLTGGDPVGSDGPRRPFAGTPP